MKVTKEQTEKAIAMKQDCIKCEIESAIRRLQSALTDGFTDVGHNLANHATAISKLTGEKTMLEAVLYQLSLTEE